MILHELKAFALREGLVDDPAFESKPVRWVIVLDEDGGYKSLRDTLQDVPLKEGQKGKPKQQAAMFAIPRRLGRTSKAVSDFLVDNPSMFSESSRTISAPQTICCCAVRCSPISFAKLPPPQKVSPVERW